MPHLLKSNSRKLILENAPKIFFVSVLYIVISTVISTLAYRLPGTVSMEDINNRLLSGELPGFNMIYTDFRPAGALLALLLYLLQPIIDVGFIRYCVSIKRAQGGDYQYLFDGFQLFIKIVQIQIISAFFVLLWSMLFLFPGLAAIYRYRQAYYILLDDPQKGALQCITESKQMMYGRKLDLFILDFSFIGWYILDFIIVILIPVPFAVPVISVWLSPYVGLTRAAFYDELVAGVAV